MTPITIQLSDKNHSNRLGEPIQVGVPVAQGQIRNEEIPGLRLNIGNTNTPCQLTPLAYWPDNSVRWLLCCFQIDLAANKTVEATLTASSLPTAEPPFEINNTETELCIKTPSRQFFFSTTQLDWRTCSTSQTPENEEIKIELTDISGKLCQAQLDKPWKIIEEGNVYITVKTDGHWQVNKKTLRFSCELKIYRAHSLVAIEICLHNPARACHQGGMWNLGDSGSLYFRSLKVITETEEYGQVYLELDHNQDFRNTELPLSIYQDSSGGENWDSRNHINKDGILSTCFKGFRVCENQQLIHEGDRALPTMTLKHKQRSLQAYIPNFWQSFPHALSGDKNGLTIGLFPSDSQFPYELQGGEKATKRCLLSYSAQADALHWARHPLTPIVDSAHYESTHAFSWFTANNHSDPLHTLIHNSLDGENNFFTKREVIDEYGWRNFGDIFADHESLYRKPDELPLISHYNNQYDAIYGFSRQFALSGDHRWFKLMHDLARHVTDIDIYHTSEDRTEYNNGLFWHTNHYVDAYRSTHRTYASENSCGGGPGAEHCYTTGLLYHYFMTGSQSSRQAVLDLANWVYSFHEGSDCLLEQLLKIKKHDLPTLKTLLKGGKPSPHRYPFTRGTGNYLNAMLDAWTLSQEPRWLEQAEKIIKFTIHPADNIDHRQLLKAEKSWSYLVLLNSLSKYLLIKKELQQQDSNYHYALAAFHVYTHWMVEHERVFMEQPEQLEYPNETWVAQDIRKAMLMYQAIHFYPEGSRGYKEKADSWLNYVINTLEKSPESHFSRINIILLQNHGPHLFSKEPTAIVDNNSIVLNESLPEVTIRGLLFDMFSTVILSLKKFSWKNEKQWLRNRLK